MTLVFEDSRMSLENELSNLSPCKNGSKTTAVYDSLAENVDKKCISNQATECNAAGGTSGTHKQGEHIAQPARLSWVEMIEAEENARLNADTEEEITSSKSDMELVASDSKMSIEETITGDSSKSNRQIEIDILDSANVEKYEKLIRGDKIKSPFKRRLSGGGEDDDGHAVFAEDDSKYSEAIPNQHKKSKTDENDHGRERFRLESTSSGEASSQSSRKPIEYEKDAAILERRQKQIDYGKNTLGYENYMQQVPRDKRTKDHPKTPPKHFKYSRRAWDGMVRIWRKKLHCYDPDAQPDAAD